MGLKRFSTIWETAFGRSIRTGYAASLPTIRFSRFSPYEFASRETEPDRDSDPDPDLNRFSRYEFVSRDLAVPVRQARILAPPFVKRDLAVPIRQARTWLDPDPDPDPDPEIDPETETETET